MISLDLRYSWHPMQPLTVAVARTWSMADTRQIEHQLINVGQII
jgi:hypothetical protein